MATVAIGFALARPESTTRPPISDEALEMTLNDRRYLMRQIRCALGEAPCDPVGRRLKSKFICSLLMLSDRKRYLQTTAGLRSHYCTLKFNCKKM